MSRRVVVTGGAGFIGSHLADRLEQDGDDVTVFDTADGRHGHRFAAGDVRDPQALAAAITSDVDVVFHMAAVVGVDHYLARPLDVVDINFNGTRRVLERAVAVGARVVVASTSEVFGKNTAVPWHEDSDRVLGPTSADRWSYSSSKALAEHLTFGFVREYGLPATVVRYFNVYGPRQRPAYLVSRSVHRVLNGRSPLIYDDGGQTRAFTYVADAVDATVRAAACPDAAGLAVNLGSTRERRIGDVVRLIGELVESPEARAVDTAAVLGARYEDLRRRVPDASRAEKLLGWTATTEIREGLLRTIDWARANPRWLALADSGAA
ncbi:NAD-dependent epimerase/dehydratase family protein [Actinoplanes sp. LDG1-06]|uniref:NAD-dependent epimerase/dehydratase family protein n=1 Tax=Paractinoplanes ovalisporus TaxID=2810368 RepID=A0ABS2AL95_9ACTN|nr:NAD-dependent epimerase/dehydratase family protein [Actinoplanes ovalisporus]MBM2620123.1 NAD-dependent epimerase/dehydratase family protein [Actinoplanes ovalisporus]